MAHAEPRSVICLPTFNEADNLPRLVEALDRIAPDAGVLVIDDHSPDGTGAVAEDLAAERPGMRVLHRPGKEGLGRAYADGFRRTLASPSVERVVQMDVDFSHPPERLPALLAALEGADVALGSRYVRGGATQNWGLGRRLISRFGSLYARCWLALPVRDPTGGYKAWRRTLLEQVLARPIAASGYAFQIETTYVAHRLGARIAEVPIVFAEREAGTSKMSPAVAWEAVWKVPLMRWQHRTVRPAS